MSEQVPGRQNQLLHPVLGGKLIEPGGIEFLDLGHLEIVGVYPNYDTAYAARKAKAQKTFDSTHIGYLIVHLHRLLDPESPGRAVR